jgi:nucleoside-diphosphate-sugar epimerase
VILTFITQMENYLIIGFGWLGKALAKELNGDRVKLWASSTDTHKLLEMETIGICGIPLLKTNQVLSWKEFPQEHFDKVIITLPPFDGVLESLSNLLNSLSYSQLVFTSSTGVYLDTDSLMDESSPINDASLVFQMEACIRTLTKSRYNVLRLAGHIGPNRHPVRFFLRQRRDISNGQAPVNLIHQKDIIAAIIVVLQDVKQDSIHNICWPEHPTKEEYYGNLVLEMGEEKLNFLKGNHGKKIDGSKITRETRFEYAHSIHQINVLDLKKDNI